MGFPKRVLHIFPKDLTVFQRGRVGRSLVKVASGCRTCGFFPGQNQSFEAVLVFLEYRKTRFYTYFQLILMIFSSKKSKLMENQ